jgi:hypothetical protein
MPTISRFFGLTITMYFDDHEPAHFHVRHAEGGAKIRIDTLEVIDSSLGRRQLRLASGVGRAPSGGTHGELAAGAPR